MNATYPAQRYRGSALLTDLYQLTMAYGYWKTGTHNKEAVFHLFFRKAPFQSGYTIAAGLSDAIAWLQGLRFAEEDLRYQASQTLQTMHDDAIEARTKLRLESETEQQAQDLADMKQKREAEREKERQSVEEARVVHQNHLAAMAADARLRAEAGQQEQALRFARATAEQDLDLKTRAHEFELAQSQADHREQLAFLGGIATLKVDVTRYLVAQYQHPDKIVRIDTAASPQLHLHEQGA